MAKIKNDELLTAEYVRSRLVYDSETGLLYWKSGNKLVGKAAGVVTLKRGVIHISIGSRGAARAYVAHRLAWLITYGEWPVCELDHINGNPSDNRLINLRLASRAENSRNARRTTNNRLRGARFIRATGSWEGRIKVNNKVIMLGTFTSAEQAHAAYCKAASKYHGEFARYD